METRNRESCPTVSSLGPYKATKLWNDAIIAFRQGVPRGKHRRFMRTAEDCFLGSTAVDWLLEYLKKQKEFGSDVTRQQTSQLLNKFYKAGIFEEIQMSRRGRNKADFSDSNRLYKLLPVSPSKGTRVPLAARTTNTIPTPPPFKIDNDEKEKQQSKEERKERTPVSKEEPDTDLSINHLPQCHLVGRFLTGSQINEIWKTAALSRLKKVLGVDNLEDILQGFTADGGHVRHNCIYLNKSGIVTNILPQDQLPHWVLSAMKCLARWPEKVEGDLPSYPGFEKDVFGVVKDYFLGLPVPLVTYDLYDVIINAFVQACNQLPRHSSPFSHTARDEKRFGYSLWSDSSLENVILNLTRKYCMTDSRTDLYSLTGSRPDLYGSNGEVFSSECCNSYSNWFGASGSRTNLTHISGSTSRHLGGSHRDLLTMGQSQNSLQHFTGSQTSNMPHSKSHTNFLGRSQSKSRSIFFSEGGPSMVSSQHDLRESCGASSKGNLHNGHSASSLHASHSSQRLFPAAAWASSQSVLGNLSVKDRKLFRSNPDLQVSSYETAFGPENQTVTRVYYCNGLSTDLHHSSELKQEELSPAETHYDVNMDHFKSHQQSAHISFERNSRSSLRNTSSNHDSCKESLRSSVGRSRSYNSFQQQQVSGGAYDSSSAFAASSKPGQEEKREDKHSLSPQWERTERKPPLHRQCRGERHHTFSGSQFAAGLGQEAWREGGGGLEDWAKGLSVSTPSLPGLKVAGAGGGLCGSSHRTSTTDVDRSVATGQALSSSRGPRPRRSSSLYLNFPQSSLQEERATRALQVVCLFLPPASRRKLHFLLKLMSKMAANPFLTLDPSQSTRSLVLGMFQHAVLRAREGTGGELDAVLVFQLVSFLMDHHIDIMAVPVDMKTTVEDRLKALEKPQIVYSPRDPGMLHYSRPLSMQQYESRKKSSSNQALTELLDNIFHDSNMPDREKRRRLKQFQKVYPQLYRQRFPDDTSDPLQTNLRHCIGKPPLFVRPLYKLKGLRV